MTDPIEEPAVGGEESEALPTPEISEPSDAALVSAPKLDEDALAEKIAEKLLPRFTEIAERRAQGIVDKRTYQFEKVAEYLKAAGGDPKRASREMAIDEMTEEHLQRRLGPSDQGRSQQSTGISFADETASLLNRIEAETGVALSAAELQSVIDERKKAGKTYRSRAEYFADISTLAVKKSKQASVDAGSVAAEGPGGTPVPKNVESLTTELAKALQRGAPVAEIKQLKEELQKAMS